MAVAEKHGQAVFSGIGDIALIRNYDEVRMSILIDVAHEHLSRLGAGIDWRTRRLGESTFSIAQHDGKPFLAVPVRRAAR